MKKNILTLLLSIIIIPINAQIHWGVKGGINYTGLLSISSKYQIGWHIGPMAEIHLPIKNLMIDVALLYQYTDYSTDFIDEEIKSIEVPVNLKYNLTSTEKVDFFVATGPQFLFLLDQSTNFASSWNFKGGIKCSKHIQLEIGYNIPLGRTFKVHMIGDNFTEKEKRKGWNISAIYLF